MFKIINKIKSFHFVLLLLLFLLPAHVLANNVTYTVCPVGCDYTLLSDALNSPGLSNDIIQPTANYIFDATQENFSNFIPATVSLSCLTGADTIGDQSITTYFLQLNSDTKVENCSFEKVNLNTLSLTNNVEVNNNTFSNLYVSGIVLNQSDNSNVEGNVGVSQISINNSDNVNIQNNQVDIIPGSGPGLILSAQNIVIPADYGVSANIPDNVLIEANVFNNYQTNTTGDWLQLYAGANIEFSKNTVQSQVVVDDQFITMMTVSNSQVDAHNNLLIGPERQPGSTNGIWAFNNRATDYNIDANYHNNTVYIEAPASNTGGDSCIGYFDDGSHIALPVTISATYNLCYREGLSPNGTAIQLSYTLPSTALTFNENSNGQFGFSNMLGDSTGTYTVASSTDITGNPLFRRENVSTTDDYELNPVSRYLDVNGLSTDIGAFGGLRSSTTNINIACTVDYSTCHSTNTNILPDSLRSGDTVLIAAGTYLPFTINDVDNITVTGAGLATIIDGTASGSAINAMTLTNSTIQNLTVRNAQNAITSYTLTSASFSTLTTDYTNPPFPFILGTGCSLLAFIVGPTDVTSIPGIGAEDFSLALLRIPDPPNPDNLFTIYFPSSLAVNQAQFEAMCPIPPGAVEHFVPSIFQIQPDNTYTYNDLAASAEGIFPTAAAPNPQLVFDNTNNSAGLVLNNSVNNQISNIISTNNGKGISFLGTSFNNTVSLSNLTGNLSSDVYSDTTGTNVLQETSFSLPNTSIVNTGLVNVFGRFQVRVLANVAGTPPITNASVMVGNALGTNIGPFVTDLNGETPLSISVQLLQLSSSSPNLPTAGGFNPFTFTVSNASGYDVSTPTVTNLVSPLNTVTITLNQAVTPATPTTSGGSGAGGNFGKPACSGAECQGGQNPTTPTEYFTDVDAHWAENYINKLAEKGIAKGYSDRTYLPDQNVTRAEFTALVVRAFYSDYLSKLEKPYNKSFPDLASDAWYTDVLAFAKQQKIIDGYGDGLFRPDQTINRAEALKIILRAGKFDLSGNIVSTPFPDVDNTAWYIKFVNFAYQNKFISGYIGGKNNGKFGPGNNITRAETAKIIDIALEFQSKN